VSEITHPEGIKVGYADIADIADIGSLKYKLQYDYV